MKQIYSYAAVVVATAGLAVGLAGGANAGVLKTAPLYACGTDKVECTGINASSMPLGFLTVAIADEDGALALKSCEDVPPGGSCSTSVMAPKGGFCGLVFSGIARHVRGSISVMDMDGNTKAALPAQ